MTLRVVARSNSPEDIFLVLWVDVPSEAPWRTDLCLIPGSPADFSFTSDSLALGSGSLLLSNIYLLAGGSDPVPALSGRPEMVGAMTLVTGGMEFDVAEDDLGRLVLRVDMPSLLQQNAASVDRLEIAEDCLLLVDTHVMGRLLSPLERVSVTFK